MYTKRKGEDKIEGICMEPGGGKCPRKKRIKERKGKELYNQTRRKHETKLTEKGKGRERERERKWWRWGREREGKTKDGKLKGQNIKRHGA